MELGDGVGEGLGDDVGCGVGDGVLDGFGDGFGNGFGDGGSCVGDGVGNGVGDAVGEGVVEGTKDEVGDGIGDGEGEGVGDGVRNGVGDGVGDGVGVGVEDGVGEGGWDGVVDGPGDGICSREGVGIGVGCVDVDAVVVAVSQRFIKFELPANMKLRQPPPVSATKVALKLDVFENRKVTARFLWSTMCPGGQGQVTLPRLIGSIGLSQPNPTCVATNTVRPSVSCSTSTSLCSATEYSSNSLTYSFSKLGLHPSEAEPSRSKTEKWNCSRTTGRLE